MAFGKLIDANPLLISKEEYRSLLTEYGVISFINSRLTQEDQNKVMSYFGTLQNWEEQQAPISFADKNNHTLINLSNEDFLGKTRMAWHMDQTYLETPYLPIRSLYSPTPPTPGNITSFLDIFTISEIVLNGYPELLSKKAKYNISYTNADNYTIRPMFSYCKHVNKHLFRFDSRMEVEDSVDLKLFKHLVKQGLEQANQYHVHWTKWSFVIFDNNRCPHRRSAMAGDCHLQRLTSTFWLEE